MTVVFAAGAAARWTLNMVEPASPSATVVALTTIACASLSRTLTVAVFIVRPLALAVIVTDSFMESASSTPVTVTCWYVA